MDGNRAARRILGTFGRANKMELLTCVRCKRPIVDGDISFEIPPLVGPGMRLQLPAAHKTLAGCERAKENRPVQPARPTGERIFADLLPPLP